MKLPRSLKGRALQLLAQREQSRIELRRKLLVHALAEDAELQAESDDADDDNAASPLVNVSAADVDAAMAATAPPAALVRVDAVLDWLEANRFLSSERFAESRVNARAPRFGNLRIHHELKQHAVVLTPEAALSLKDSELARACAVREREFKTAPQTAAERAKQGRFLMARGFSPETIRRALRELPSDGDEVDDSEDRDSRDVISSPPSD